MCAHYGTFLFLLDLDPGGVARAALQHPTCWPENLDGVPAYYPHSGKM